MAAAVERRSDLAYNDQKYYGQRQIHNGCARCTGVRREVKLSSAGNHAFTIYIGLQDVNLLGIYNRAYAS
jgi:hypothetical protein